MIELPIPCLISIDQGTPQAVTTLPLVILQATNSSTTSTRLKRIQMQSSITFTTAPAGGLIPPIVTVSFGLYTGATAGGTTVTAVPTDGGLQGVYTPQTAFKALTTILGTGFSNQSSWSWNTALDFDISGIREITTGSGFGTPPAVTEDESKAGAVWALVMTGTLAQGFNLTGVVNFDECGSAYHE
jgi:hypothetical protein